MKSNSSRGRSITNDSSVQTLFMNTMAMHSKLLKHIQDQEDKRVHYEGLQDKLAQVKDARAALEALREEERERKRREAEEAERQRQIQMREKLELMRKKKTEYLQYQRQLALQKMQEQEREMLLRQEHSKQQYMQHPHPSMYPGAPPQMYNPYYPPGTYGPPPPGPQPGMQYQSMPMQPPPPAAGTMAQPPNSMVAPTGPQMAYGMPPPGSATPSTTEATGVPSTTFNMASMGAALTHPGGQQPPVYQTAPQGMPQPPVMTQMTPGMQMPPAPQQQDPQAPKQGSNAQALAELISFD
jgi:growth factor-regulated tyrosine kinase substrate